MGKYLKKFNTHTEYETYINGSDKVLPNVSLCATENEMHYNPWVETRVIGIFNVIDDTQKTAIMSLGGCYWISKVEVDGINYNVEDTDNGKLQLSLGTHAVKYTLKNPTIFGGEIDGVLDGCTSLTSVTIPDSVTSIGDMAFNDCSGLISVTIGNSVTSIGFSAFGGCTALTSVTIPSSVTSIGANAFEHCPDLTTVVVDSGNSVYDSRNNCNAIIETATNTLIVGCKNTVIPNSVTSIGDTAFYYCTSLTSITIPDSVTSIGDESFYHCTALTSVTIGNSVTSIGSAFAECSSLTNITSFATTAPTIALWTFLRVKTGGTLYVPSGSTGYDVWMGTSANYLGYYNWTKVEQ